MPNNWQRLICACLSCLMFDSDIIFNFHKAYYILDEMFVGGELLETSKREVLRVTAARSALGRC